MAEPTGIWLEEPTPLYVLDTDLSSVLLLELTTEASPL